MRPAGILSALPTPTEATVFIDAASVRAWTGLSEDARNAVDSVLGGVPNVRVLAVLPRPSLQAAIVVARVTTDRATGTVRKLTPVEVTQVGLMWRAARSKLQLPDEDPTKTEAPVGGGVAAPAPAGGPVTPVTPVRKVKMSSVLDQGDEADITLMEGRHGQVLWQIDG